MASPSTVEAGAFEDAGSSSSDNVDLETAAATVANDDVHPVDADLRQTEVLSPSSKIDTPRQQTVERAVHAHRVNHNSSKLPAYRFADRTGDSLGLPVPGLLQGNINSTTCKQHPSPPVSSVSSGPDPGPGPGVVAPTSPKPPVDSTLETAHQEDRPGQNASEPENQPSTTDPAEQRPVTESHHLNQQQTSPDTSRSTATSKHSPARSGASTIQPATTSVPVTITTPATPSTPTAAAPVVAVATIATATATATTAVEHPASSPIDNSPIDATSPGPSPSQTDESPSFSTPATLPRTRHAEITPTSNNTTPPLARRHSQSAHSSGTTANDRAQSHREFLSPKAVNGDFPHDDKIERRKSTSRPPVSYRPFRSSSTPGRPIIPPIRSFRSSGSRHSPKSDMNYSASRSFEDGDRSEDSNHRYQSLRALEGRASNDWTRDFSPPNADATLDTIESENTTDIFLNIAREDSSSSARQKPGGHGGHGDEAQNGPNSRPVRSARQRPFSTAIPTPFQNPTSPPRVSRRLSDQQVRKTHARRPTEDQPIQPTIREITHRSSTIDRPSLSLDSNRARSTAPALKPSPITPRTSGAHDTSADGSSIFARRPATTDHPRSSHRHASGLSKSFNSSQSVAGGGGREASESSNSTAAASTVWDELDELKSRIHRLELTGKLPRTSGAAISGASDERPPTAGTGATTLSGSPKRVSGAGTAQTEVLNSTSAQRELQPILKSALSKTKPFVSSDIYDAVEAAANDALSLSQMMGAVGQPGPISSGASTIGVGGASTVTDRQLRKKTDSLCRSLTELCLALTDEGSRRQPTAQKSQSEPRETATSNEQDLLSSPPPMKVFSGAPRREAANADEPVPSIENMTSPRTTRLEKRATFNFTGMTTPSILQSPRYAPSALGSEAPTPGRKSSLIINRSRRGVTEEPDDQGRKTSLLRTRRAGTDDPDEGRRTSLLLPSRRVTSFGRANNIDEEPESHFRVPSRAVTEVGGLRIEVPSRDREDMTRGSVQVQEPSSASSALPRRRLITSNLPTPHLQSSRLATPTTPSARRFFGVDRSAQLDRQERQDRGDTSNLTERLAEERGQRQYQSGPSTTSYINRRASIGRKRQSGIPSFSGTASNVGGYR